MAKNTDIIALNNGFTRNQSNVSTAITNAKTKMTATELKIFYQVTTLIKQDDTDFSEYSMSVADFCEKLNLNSSNRDFIVKTCKSLLRQVFEVELPNGNYYGYTIFSRMHYLHDKQEINFKFNNEVKPFLLELKNRFTKIHQVKYITAFDSKYAIRIYAMLKDYRLMSEREFEIEKLTEILQLPKSYAKFTRLYENVIEPSINEINEKSDLFVEFDKTKDIKKQGKKITHFTLHFGNQADKISLDITKELFKLYKKYKTLNVFIGQYYITNENYNLKNKPRQIGAFDIDTYMHYTTIKDKDGYMIWGTAISANEITKELCNGIYRAGIMKYEKEKKERLQLEIWQKKQDDISWIKSWISNNISDKYKS